jgi:hypothetical protein
MGVSNHMVSDSILTCCLETKAGGSIKGVETIEVNHMDRMKVFWKRLNGQMSRNWDGM